MNWYSRPVCNSRSFHSWEGKLGLFWRNWRFFLSKEVFLKQSFNSLYTFNDQIASEHGGTLRTFFKLCPLTIALTEFEKKCVKYRHDSVARSNRLISKVLPWPHKSWCIEVPHNWNFYQTTLRFIRMRKFGQIWINFQIG